MKENLYYLFISGLILGSGPCLSFCAPVLIGYTAAFKASTRKSILSYLIFSFFKIIGYVLLGVVCALGVKLLNSPLFLKYTDYVYIALGCFVTMIGLSVLFLKGNCSPRICAWLHKGNIRNVGILGLLVGLSPCLPLLGILNYIVIVSNNATDAMTYTFVFGLGTVLSPLLLLIVLSAKLAELLSKNDKLQMAIRLLCGALLLFLGIKVIIQALPL